MSTLGKCIELSHGSGGRSTTQLVEALFRDAFATPGSAVPRAEDATSLGELRGRVVVSTDAFVVTPIEFPGGDIGALAVHGTVNDVAMAGAEVKALTAAFVLEEGLEVEVLRRIVVSMARAAREAGVPIVAGDTKVVERGAADGLFITTTGIGVLPERVVGPSVSRARGGDAVIVSGFVGDHGVAVLSSREGLSFESPIVSDTAALNRLVAAMTAVAPDLHVLRDPTRGGLATTLNEIAHGSGVAIEVEEDTLPIRPAVNAACELLGLDPLYLANEGKLVCVCSAEDEARVLAAMRAHPRGADARRIGTVTAGTPGLVRLRTRLGSGRILEWLSSEPLPRIC